MKARRKRNADGVFEIKVPDFLLKAAAARSQSHAAQLLYKLDSLNAPNQELMASGVRQILMGMGVDLDDVNFSGTPARVAKLYAEMLTPQVNNWKTFPATTSDMVILRNHRVIALCPHHLMPAVISCSVGYIPHKLTLGLSKLARAVEEQLTRPILQEDLANAVAEKLNKVLEPKGCGIVLVGTHGCMKFRGVESDGDVVTSVMKGVLLLNPAARMEFLQLIGRP